MSIYSPLFKEDKPHFHTNGGELAVGYGIYTYYAGTNTPVAMYSDPAGAAPYQNPIVLNFRGEPNGQGIYADVTHEYKIVFKDSNGSVLWSMDHVKAGSVGDITVDGITSITPGSSNVHVNMSPDGSEAEISVDENHVQSDWNEADSSSDAFIKNKPSIPAAQVQSDWGQSDSTAKDYIKNKPTIPTVPIQTVKVNGTALTPDVNGAVDVTKSGLGLGNVTNDAQVKRSEMGTANGVATLDANGKVLSSQIPGSYDDVKEGYLHDGKFYEDSQYATEIPAEGDKVYVDIPTNKTYRWSGTQYVIIGNDLALGETSSTAYRGDRGKTAYDHSQTAHARADATKVEASSTNGNVEINGVETNVYTHPSATAASAAAVKVGKDSQGHVVLGSAITPSDIGAATASQGALAEAALPKPSANVGNTMKPAYFSSNGNPAECYSELVKTGYVDLETANAIKFTFTKQTNYSTLRFLCSQGSINTSFDISFGTGSDYKLYSGFAVTIYGGRPLKNSTTGGSNDYVPIVKYKDNVLYVYFGSGNVKRVQWMFAGQSRGNAFTVEEVTIPTDSSLTQFGEDKYKVIPLMNMDAVGASDTPIFANGNGVLGPITGPIPVSLGGTGVNSSKGGTMKPVYLDSTGIKACNIEFVVYDSSIGNTITFY